jgi:hypothetical protein
MAKQKIKSSLAKARATHSDFWAFATVMAFPTAVLTASAFGVPHTEAFFWGISSSLAALFCNTMTERRLWMFDPKWQQRFEQPDFSFRLAVVTGAILLILESAVLVLLFSGNVERNLMGIVFERQCRNPQPHQVEFCKVLDRTLARRAP